MSDRNKIIVLASLCAVLTLTLLLGIFFSGNRRSSRAQNEPLLASFSGKKVNQIELFSEEKTVTVTETEEGLWAVDYDGTAAPADTSRVSAFLSAVAALPRGKKITVAGGAFQWSLLKKNAHMGSDFCNGDAVTDYLYNGRVAADDFNYLRVFCVNGRPWLRSLFTCKCPGQYPDGCLY